MHFLRLRPEPPPGAVSRAGGFTLLELVVVLVIISFVVGLGVMSFDGVVQEGELRKPVLEFKDLTAEAVRRATLYERPQVLIFDSAGMVMPLRMRRESAGAVMRVKRFTLPPGMSLMLRRFGSDKFAPAEGQRLIVSPSGLCEPLTARFQRGQSWFEVTLDPLTGAAKEERMVVQ
ncbi:prepilin-type N-terminal cleavage/methylation domain-containing protein [Roseimicrobium gellanilyticum]|uniref:Prepilin-type N-terminal cleavage/methylation domain-containing protein n=1 Tax=Roseimicrobium gellanilyticum TaxID=748857 RepID=A0A366H0H6_9BACT|nr:prepilin-type N-terminal cleavage/methylation domain-containing protein [Roseimicrobium gellanilyticum]RBP35340.1 prepilin-type N-terminal cleavage/methylation domain-containing protein [Roseimicrobium gellanilyticum]